MSESSFSPQKKRPGKPARKDQPTRTAGDAVKNQPTRTAGDTRKTPTDKRQRILDAAVRVFAQNGFYATRVADVAKAAGVADGTIYLYFASKDDLLHSLFEDRLERLLSFVGEGLSQQQSARAQLSRIIELQLGVYEGEPELAEVMTVILRQSPKLLKEHARPGFLAYLDVIAAVVSRGQEQGEFRRDLSPHFVARALFGALDGLALTWALGRAERGGLSRSATQVSELFLKGLAA